MKRGNLMNLFRSLAMTNLAVWMEVVEPLEMKRLFVSYYDALRDEIAREEENAVMPDRARLYSLSNG